MKFGVGDWRVLPLAAVAAVATAVLVAGCGSSGGGKHVASSGKHPAAAKPKVSASADATARGKVAAQCLRDHGVQAKDPVLPLPQPINGVSMFGPGLSSAPAATRDAALKACAGQVQAFAQLAAPAASLGITEAGKAAFAKCMRTHGVPNFPDPVPGQDKFPLAQNGIDPNSPQMLSGAKACGSLLTEKK